MKKFIANLLVSSMGRILLAVVSAAVSAAMTRLAGSMPWMKPLLEIVNPYELSVMIMAVLMVTILTKVNGVLGEAVKPVQRWLQSLGYQLDVDGWWGDKTATAVSEQTGMPVRQAVPVVWNEPEKRP